MTHRLFAMPQKITIQCDLMGLDLSVTFTVNAATRVNLYRRAVDGIPSKFNGHEDALIAGVEHGVLLEVVNAVQNMQQVVQPLLDAMKEEKPPASETVSSAAEQITDTYGR